MTTHGEEIEEEQISRIEEGRSRDCHGRIRTVICTSPSIVCLTQKFIAEMIGTYFVMFSGCGVVVVNVLYGGKVTFPGICVTWSLIVMIMIYSIGHISGAHFNPAVTVTSAIFRRFPWRQIGELAGIAVGMTIILNVFVAGPILGASMNPARSLGPAIVLREYKVKTSI